MAHVDALNRAPIEQSSDTDDYVYDKRLSVMLTFTKDEQMTMIQQSDDELRRLIDILRRPPTREAKKNVTWCANTKARLKIMAKTIN